MEWLKTSIFLSILFIFANAYDSDYSSGNYGSSSSKSDDAAVIFGMLVFLVIVLVGICICSMACKQQAVNQGGRQQMRYNGNQFANVPLERNLAQPNMLNNGNRFANAPLERNLAQPPMLNNGNQFANVPLERNLVQPSYVTPARTATATPSPGVSATSNIQA